MRDRLSEEQIGRWLAERGGAWRREGEEISRSFKLGSFRGAVAFVNQVAEYAESANHHPSIRIDYRQVTLSLTTHDAGGITELDCRSAQEYDNFYEHSVK